MSDKTSVGLCSPYGCLYSRLFCEPLGVRSVLQRNFCSLVAFIFNMLLIGILVYLYSSNPPEDDSQGEGSL